MSWKATMRRAVLASVAGALLFVAITPGFAQGGANDAQIQSDVVKALDNKRFKDVKSSVQNGVVTLTGTVDLYSSKLDADNRAHHRKNVKGVENQIQVIGPTVEDTTLRDKLAEKLAGETGRKIDVMTADLTVRGDVQRSRFRYEPALSFVPLARPPPNGC